MTELEKDLEIIDAEAAECLLDIYPGKYVQYVAARLAELGYVKVVRCGECKWGVPCPCQSCFGTGRIVCVKPDNVDYETGLGRDVNPDAYCSAGERVVAQNATGEEA